MSLSFELFIAKRIISSQPDNKNKTKPLVGTAIIAIALGLAVMILSVAILTGFKKEITDKLVGFSSHIQIVNLDNNSSFETAPIETDRQLEKQFEGIPEILHYQRFATKAGIINAKPDLQGVVLKGIDESYNYDFLSRFLISGEIKPLLWYRNFKRSYNFQIVSLPVKIRNWGSNSNILHPGSACRSTVSNWSNI